MMGLMATSSSNSKGSQQYPHPSHVNAASFVSIKLSGMSNYVAWEKQIRTLLLSHDMLGFIDGSISSPGEKINGSQNIKYLEWQRSDALVLGWILGSLSEHVLEATVDGHAYSAFGAWSYLTMYDPERRNTSSDTDAAYSPATDTDTETNSKDRIKKFDKYIPLRRAIQLGDWNAAHAFFERDKDALTDKLDYRGFRALHLAIRNLENIAFLENLLNQINPELLPNLVVDHHIDPLVYAVLVYNNLAVQKLVQKNPRLLFPYQEASPLLCSVMCSNKTACLYLLRKSKEHIRLVDEEHPSPFEGLDGHFLLIDTIMVGFIDVAYEMLKEFPNMAGQNHSDLGEVLRYLAQKSDMYPSAKRYNFYQKFVYSHIPVKNSSLGDTPKISDIENQETYKVNHVSLKSYIYPVTKKIFVKFWDVLLHVPHIKQLHKEKVEHNASLAVLKYICEEVGKLEHDGYKEYERALILAVENDIPEVVEHIIGLFPDSLQISNDKRITLLQLSVINRCENVYKYLEPELTYKSYLRNRLILAPNHNNILHFAGKLAPLDKLNMVTGAALQMQRELQWFQEVSKVLQHSEITKKNKENKTPIMVFTKEHEDLRQKGEEWMKKTADSYTITAALIITIVFAAAITVPGGNNENTGKPIYKTKASFIIFIVADAISLFTSTTSLLLFLSILTARYSYDDFLYKLPKSLILGLIMLFLSVTTMLIAFGSTLYIMSGQENLWILVPIAALTCLPIASFVTLQLPLLADLISSTYSRGIFRTRSELSVTS